MRRPAPPRDIPPPLELECLKVLWKLGEASVKDVRAELFPSRNLAYTTVMTLMERLVRKGGATRRKAGRMFIYAPGLARDYLRRLAVQELAASLFDGSPDELLGFLQGQPPAPAPVPPTAPQADEELDTALL
jgi:predicted transcriptional regulator